MVRSFLGDKCLVQTPVPLNAKSYTRTRGSLMNTVREPKFTWRLHLFTSDSSINRSNIRKLGSVFIINDKLMFLSMLAVLILRRWWKPVLWALSTFCPHFEKTCLFEEQIFQISFKLSLKTRMFYQDWLWQIRSLTWWTWSPNHNIVSCLQYFSSREPSSYFSEWPVIDWPRMNFNLNLRLLTQLLQCPSKRSSLISHKWMPCHVPRVLTIGKNWKVGSASGQTNPHCKDLIISSSLSSTELIHSIYSLPNPAGQLLQNQSRWNVVFSDNLKLI